MQPIFVPSIPESQDPLLWQQVAKRLAKFDAHEKELYDLDQITASDRLANKVIPLAESYVRKGEWANLWNWLQERGVIAVGIPEPEPKEEDRPKRTYTQHVKRVRRKGLTRFRVGSIKNEFRESLPLILTDKWNTIDGIADKFKELHPNLDVSNFRDYNDYLREFSRLDMCYAYKEKGDKLTYYSSNPDAVEFERVWISRFRAHKFAVANGYTGTFEYFSNRAFYRHARSHQDNAKFYAQYRLEFREGSDDEVIICKWRVFE